MSHIEKVRCPNCGSVGERHHILESRVVRTQCAVCDYLLVTCGITGQVIEAYAPGLSVSGMDRRSQRQRPRSIR